MVDHCKRQTVTVSDVSYPFGLFLLLNNSLIEKNGILTKTVFVLFSLCAGCVCAETGIVPPAFPFFFVFGAYRTGSTNQTFLLGFSPLFLGGDFLLDGKPRLW
jgi:hypothetical protein